MGERAVIATNMTMHNSTNGVIVLLRFNHLFPRGGNRTNTWVKLIVHNYIHSRIRQSGNFSKGGAAVAANVSEYTI